MSDPHNSKLSLERHAVSGNTFASLGCRAKKEFETHTVDFNEARPISFEISVNRGRLVRARFQGQIKEFKSADRVVLDDQDEPGSIGFFVSSHGQHVVTWLDGRDDARSD